MVKGFVNYTYDTGVGTGYGGGASVKHMRFEDVHFVSNTVDYAIWFQLTPRYWTGRGYPEGRGIAKPIPIDDVRFVNCTFENDGGHIWIDGGDSPLTNFVFENCTFYHADPAQPDGGEERRSDPVQERQDQRNGDPECSIS